MGTVSIGPPNQEELEVGEVQNTGQHGRNIMSKDKRSRKSG